MAEAGGTTTQDGVYYQNSVAAQHLAELVSLEPRLTREQVVEVRVEAPAHVDDVVVRYADGHRDWIQAKVALRSSGEAWSKLWVAFAAQVQEPIFGADDRLVLALGKHGGLADDLQTIIERACSSQDESEWRERLGVELSERLDAVEGALPNGASAFNLFRRVDVRVVVQQDIETAFQRLDLGTTSALPKQLLSNLRDLVGGYSRVRGIFRAGPLRQLLARDFGVDLFEPREWGLAAYRSTLQRLTRVELPGRGVSAPVDDLFVWPRARRLGTSPSGDFEDEMPRWDAPAKEGLVDLAQFPNNALARLVIVAGPGFGKSTLLQAVTAKLVNTPVVPVEVPLGAFAQSDHSVIEYLESRANQAFSTRVDWRRLADQGLACALFDGLDEVPTDQRGDIIKRIGLFAARFPDVPWVLTVRDPAALNAPLDAELIELQPFENREISALLRKYRPWLSGLEDWAFFDALQAYPDIARLAKIPLFLSIMLAGWEPGAPLPRKRSDLIERYLRTLFDPDKRKAHAESRMSSLALRKIAQAIAFASLEREEIGLSERQAFQAIANLTSEASDGVLSELEGAGVLRRRIDGRLQFPYPIVQEYLAAVHLVDERPEAVATRIGDVVKRPWAQVVQFALELIDDPSDHIRQMLQVPDDAFSTSLRLIGRCIANGARVTPDLKDEILVKLAELWGSAGWAIRERVGRLIVDGFSHPLHPEIRRRLGWSWVVQSGADEIVVRENDPVLTLEVVDQLLEDESSFMPVYGLGSVLKDVAAQVASRVVARAHRQGVTDLELHGLTQLLGVIRLTPKDSHLLVSLAEDETLPSYIRLGAYAAMAPPSTPDALILARTAMADDNWRSRSASIQVLAQANDPVSEVGALLIDDIFPSTGKEILLDRVHSLFSNEDMRRSAISKLLASPGIQERHINILRIYAARGGDRSLFLELIDQLDQLDADLAAGVLVSLNRFPEAALGASARVRLEARSDPPNKLPSLVSSAFHGLTALVEEFGWNSYAFDDAPDHPDIANWGALFEAWLQTPGLSKVQRLRMIDSMLRLRPELIGELETIVLSATDPDASDWDEDDYGHVLRQAIDTLRQRGVKIPMALAETFARATRPNLLYAGIAAIAAEATPEALDRLFRLYRELKKNREVAFDAIELLSTRLNRRVVPEDLWPDSSVTGDNITILNPAGTSPPQP